MTTNATPTRSHRRVGTACLAVLVATMFASCQEVAFYEKQYLANSLMQFETDPTLDNLMQKVFYSREATTGGIGSKAGGGCGCTN